jgi:spore maturation protein A
MLNIIFAVLLGIGFLFSVFTNNLQNFSDAFAKGGINAVNLMIKLCGGICFWSGILNILEKSGLSLKISKFLSPVTKLIFPEIKKKDTLSAINLNITSNFLGLGNASTPFGIKAMKLLDRDNNHSLVASHSMCKFVLMNTASIQFIPTTLIVLRQSFGASTPPFLLISIWVSSFVSCLAGILLCFIFAKRRRKL